MPIKIKWFLYSEIPDLDLDPIHLKEFLEENTDVEGQVWVRDVTDYASEIKAEHLLHLFTEDEDDAVILAEYLVNEFPKSRVFVEGIGEIGALNIHVTCYFHDASVHVNSLEELMDMVRATCKIERFNARDITRFSQTTSARGVIRFYVANHDDAELIQEFLLAEFGDKVKVYISEKNQQ